MKKLITPAFAAILTASLGATAWDGTDTETGADVEIQKGNLVRTGNTIDVYDYDKGDYRSMTVEDINRYGNTVEIEVTDEETGETTTLEMEDQ